MGREGGLEGGGFEMDGLPHHVEKILVLLPLPGLRTKKQDSIVTDLIDLTLVMFD